MPKQPDLILVIYVLKINNFRKSFSFSDDDEINIKSFFQMRIRLKEFNGVAIWKWVTNDD